MADIPNKILNGCKKGDSRSQEELYRLVAPKMYGLCLQYAGNTEDANDIMQEGFIKVFTKISQFSGKGSLEGWIRRIMINTALEKYRSHINMYPLDEKISSNEDLSYEDVLDQLNSGQILELIQNLSPRYRMVFNLYAIEGYSHKEIAEMMNITEGTSKSNLSRARSILQEKVKILFQTSGKVK